MEDLLSCVAVVNKRAESTGNELSQLVEIAKESPNITDVKVRKSNVTFSATADEMERLRAKFGNKLIIEINKTIQPLR